MATIKTNDVWDVDRTGRGVDVAKNGTHFLSACCVYDLAGAGLPPDVDSMARKMLERRQKITYEATLEEMLYKAPPSWIYPGKKIRITMEEI